MSDLHIALQDGFTNDTVAITVNQRQVFAKSGVTTNRVIARADTVDTSVDGPSAAIRVEVSTREAVASLQVTLADTPFVAVNLSPDGGITLTPSRKPFGYM